MKLTFKFVNTSINYKVVSDRPEQLPVEFVKFHFVKLLLSLLFWSKGAKLWKSLPTGLKSVMNFIAFKKATKVCKHGYVCTSR